MRTLASLALLLCLCCVAAAQPGGRDSKKKSAASKAAEELRKAAAAEGANELRVRSNVFNNVTAQAVLIPAADARRIFGKEVAEHYAVVELNVGNKSEDAALVVHNVFIDYSLWPLSGTRPDSAALRAKAESMDGRFGPYQSTSFPNHIASEEYRVVRGQFLNAQTWSWRNKILRLAELAGNIAGAYTFSINEQGFIKGIAAFNGVVVPGLRTAWPDTSLQQMNLINDVGFRTNTLVPKQAAEVIVCFFPIDRFLTPGLKKLFLKSPAVFFAPLQIVVDRSLEKDVKQILGNDLGLSLDDFGATPGAGTDVLGEMRKRLPCYLRVMKHAQEVRANPEDTSVLGQIYQSGAEDCLAEFGLVERTSGKGEGAHKVIELDRNIPNAHKRLRSFLALDYIAQVSLNNVGVTVDGAMTVDTTAIPARITDVALDADEKCGPDQECFWSVPEGGTVVRTGTVEGAYLTGGAVAIAEGNALGITDVKAVSEGSNDQSLKFSFKMTKSVPAGKRLTFRVTKPKAGSSTTVDSQPFVIPVGFTEGQPVFARAAYDEETGKLTLSGSGFALNATSVELVAPPGGTAPKVTPSAESTGTTLLLDIPAASRAPGCWEARVTVNGRKAEPFARKFLDKPDQQPKVNSATLKEDSIEVVGEHLVDASACGGKELGFEAVKEKMEAGDKPLKLEFDPESLTPTGVKLDLSDEDKDKLKDGEWKIRVLTDGKVVKGAQPKLTKD
ncbi:MAG TPA: hypothetical protein VF736_09840 [Pyrinomonadaceae bacterium]|jgi:hypothetical protein